METQKPIQQNVNKVNIPTNTGIQPNKKEKIDPNKEKKLREERRKKEDDRMIRAILSSEYYRRKNGVEKYPREIHYSKLLIDEAKKSKKKKGQLYIQKGEKNINNIQKIKERFSINENLFVSTDYDIEELDEETSSESKMVEKDEEKEERKIIQRPKTYLNSTYETVYESFKNSEIPEKYHTVLSVLNLSYQDYYDNLSIYHREIKSNDENIEKTKMIDNIKNIMEEEKHIKINKIPLLVPYLEHYIEQIKKLLNFKVNSQLFIVDNFSVFLLFKFLVIEKSFWMLIPKKNRNFLVYICERIFELLDEINSTIEYYITENHAISSEKSTINVVKNIIKPYYSKKGKGLDGVAKVVLSQNNLEENTPLIEGSVIYFNPDKNYLSKNSYANKFEKLNKNNIISIFKLLDIDSSENLSILLLSGGAKGLIQYLFISSLLLIFKNGGESENTFKEYLLKLDENSKLPRIKFINDQLRSKFKMITEDYDTNSNDVYKRFLQYIWDEYKNIREVRNMSK